MGPFRFQARDKAELDKARQGQSRRVDDQVPLPPSQQKIRRLGVGLRLAPASRRALASNAAT